MKHALSSNECPFCGNFLLNNEDLKKCKKISYDLLNAGFKESDVYDISIFIYNTYIKELGLDTEKEVFEETSFEEEVPSENIEVEERIFEEEEPEDYDDRVSRLRELAKNNPILNKKGTSVRRVSD